ncbi:MAG: polysaccharide deacetylase family protein [Clostridia bacterium]|nr:polysaccharide deacetylase family protein [Clostridia bacterium]
MKFKKFLLASLIGLAIANNQVFGVRAEKINWFFKPKGDNLQPEILGGDVIAKEHGALYLGPEGDKTVYLTFDAGYSNENVERTLDILQSQNVKGAFFILPGIIKNSKETVIRMAEEGHLVCNHSTSHCDMSKITNIEKFKEELSGVEEIYTRETGFTMEKYFRPPEGAFSKKTLEFCETLGYTPVFWSFAYADWDNSKQMNAEKAKEKVLSNVHDGMVILLHPTSKTNALILDSVITSLKEQGYTFGTLDELKNKSR